MSGAQRLDIEPRPVAARVVGGDALSVQQVVVDYGDVRVLKGVSLTGYRWRCPA